MPSAVCGAGCGCNGFLQYPVMRPPLQNSAARSNSCCSPTWPRRHNTEKMGTSRAEWNPPPRRCVMERELWPPLYRALREVGKDFLQKYVSYPPWVIAAVFLWAAVHDRPVSWACRPAHWSTTRLRPSRLPSAATLSRRADGLPFGCLLRSLEQRLREQGEQRLLSLLDGKPLPVSNVSKDPDAKRGRGAGGMGKGYKLHTVWSGRPLPEAWEVTPLNEAESAVGQRLVQQRPGAGYLLADGNYDSSPLYDDAAAQGYQLLTPLPQNAGQGHRYQSPHRLRCRDLWQGEFGR